MSEGTPSPTGSAFGPEFAVPLDTEETPVDEWSDEALDAGEASVEAPTEPGPQEPAPQPQGQQAEPGVAPEPVQPPSDQEGQQEPESTETAQEPLYAGRYRSPEDLEHGYKNIQRLQTRTQEQLQREQLEKEQYRAALEQLAPYLEELQQGQQAPSPDGITPEYQQPQLDPQQVQRLIQQEAEKVRTETQAQSAQQELRRTVEGFIATHPDAAPGTPLDHAIGEVLEEFQTDASGQRRYDLFPVTESNLQTAYELAQAPDVRNMVVDLDLVPNAENIAIAKEALSKPELAEVLTAQPTLLDSDKGLEYARKLAGLPGMYAQAAQRVQPPSPEQARRAAHVETGGTGAPVQQAPGATPPDPMDEALAAWNSGRTDNIFGLAVE